MAWSPDGHSLVTGGEDKTIRVWDGLTGQPVATLEGHSNPVYGLSVSSDGKLLASQSGDGTVCIWSVATREPLGALRVTTRGKVKGLAFHPTEPLLATRDEDHRVVRIWRIDVESLLKAQAIVPIVRYTTAKIPLVGDQQVGKTSLGHRLLTGEFKLFSRTHGQQFWPFPALSGPRADGVECEAILWDLAGQPDYRLTHSLFLDDADLALILFNATDRQDPLKGVEYWLKVLKSRPGGPCPTILIGAQTDIGSPSLTPGDLAGFCQTQGITGGYVGTSACTGEGIDDLVMRLRQHIPWDRLPPTTTTATFKRIKDYVLGLKAAPGAEGLAMLTPAELRARLEASDTSWTFTGDQMMTAAGHLANHGFVTMLRTTSGESRILLEPDLLINLTASIVLEARRNPKGLGALQESEVRRGVNDFPELQGLAAADRQTLLDAAIALFLEHHVCFRETLGPETLLIFPALIHQYEPPDEVVPTVEDSAYVIEGAVEHLYSTLVVLLGYTNTVTRSSQWFGQARYELSGAMCGFRSVSEREGELRLVLYYGEGATPSVHRLFEGLFETFLQARELKVTKYASVSCPGCRYRQERDEIVKRVVERRGFVRCAECGEKIDLPKAGERLTLPAADRALLEGERRAAARRTEYETALSRVKGLVRDRGDTVRPSCFVSYAWGVPEHERWVARLVQDLKNADVQTTFDRQDNVALGRDVARFVSDGLTESAFVVVVGTFRYLEKYQNKLSSTGSIVAAEMDLIHQRLTGDESKKRTVLPVLLEGDSQHVFPPLLRGRTRADFTSEQNYFRQLLDLVLTLHRIDHADAAVADLRNQLLDER
jgi:hypothetical protein